MQLSQSRGSWSNGPRLFSRGLAGCSEPLRATPVGFSRAGWAFARGGGSLRVPCTSPQGHSASPRPVLCPSRLLGTPGAPPSLPTLLSYLTLQPTVKVARRWPCPALFPNLALTPQSLMVMSTGKTKKERQAEDLGQGRGTGQGRRIGQAPPSPWETRERPECRGTWE